MAKNLIDDVTFEFSEGSPSGHTHDDRYYTESEMTDLLAGKSDTGHTHDDRYYTETETNGLLSAKADLSALQAQIIEAGQRIEVVPLICSGSNPNSFNASSPVVSKYFPVPIPIEEYTMIRLGITIHGLRRTPSASGDTMLGTFAFIDSGGIVPYTNTLPASAYQMGETTSVYETAEQYFDIPVASPYGCKMYGYYYKYGTREEVNAVGTNVYFRHTEGNAITGIAFTPSPGTGNTIETLGISATIWGIK